MRKPGTDPENVEMSDVLCDFCHRQWTDDVPMLEGHHGSCICGNCLTVACMAIRDGGTAGEPYECRMCLEAASDRAALDRVDEPAWQSPVHEDACVCRRCVDLAAKALDRDKDYDWCIPT